MHAREVFMMSYSICVNIEMHWFIQFPSPLLHVMHLVRRGLSCFVETRMPYLGDKGFKNAFLLPFYYTLFFNIILIVTTSITNITT